MANPTKTCKEKVRNFILDRIPPPHVLLPRQRDSHLLGHRAGLGHHQVGEVALLPPAGLDEEQLGSPVQLSDVTHLSDETLDVPGLGSLAALDEVVCCAVADDQEQEAAGVLVFVLTGELLLQIVHFLAVQVRVDLNVKP